MIEIFRELKLNIRIPIDQIKSHLNMKERAMLTLSHMYYYSLYLGKDRSAYRRGAYSLGQTSDYNFENFLKKGLLQKLSGIGSFTEKVIEDCLTGKSEFLGKLMDDFNKVKKT